VPTTPNMALRYPALSDAPNVPQSMQNLASDVDTAFAVPLCRLVQSVVQTGLANNTLFAVSFTSEDVDTHGFHDNATNNSRITPTVAGWYRASGGICFAARNDYTLLHAYYRKNGATAIGPSARFVPVPQSTAQTQTLSQQANPGPALISFNGSTDYLELVGLSINLGSATFSTVSGGAQISTLEVEYIRPL
jgi:hypothetical protein